MVETEAIVLRKEQFKLETVDTGALGKTDLLVSVKAISVNPVDTKVRKGFGGASSDGKILGYDCAGVVEEVGPECKLFKVGDEIWYAGNIARQGTNARKHVVEERLVSLKPKNLDWSQAAALPLTTITAYEALFVHMNLQADSEGWLLVNGGAGGVGSIMIQLARQLTKLKVIATASRPETVEYCKKMGAHHVVNHHDLLKEVQAITPQVNYILSSYSSQEGIDTFVQLLASRGRVVAIDEPKGLDTSSFQSKSAGWHWEFMFSVALNEPGSTSQHELLKHVAQMVDDGKIQTTMNTKLQGFSVENLDKAHQMLSSGKTIGKVVIEF